MIINSYLDQLHISIAAYSWIKSVEVLRCDLEETDREEILLYRFRLFLEIRKLSSSYSFRRKYRSSKQTNKRIGTFYYFRSRTRKLTNFMSIREAARLVIQAGALGKGGEVFLLDMGEPVKIIGLAKQMIKLSGLTEGKDIEIKITGLRPGEKLYEELLIDGNGVTPSSHPKIFFAQETMIPWEHLEKMLETLFRRAEKNQTELLQTSLKELVPEYHPS